MALRVSGLNLDIGDALRTHVQTKVGETLTRYFDRDFNGHVTVRKEGATFRTDCLIHLPTGLTLQAESMAHDPHASVDQAADRLTKRLKRYKQKIKDYHVPSEVAPAAEATESIITAPDHEADGHDGDFTPVIVAENTGRMKSFSVSEAVVHLDMTGAAALVFRHAGHGRVNVVYRRPDGHIGWIDLPGAAADAG